MIKTISPPFSEKELLENTSKIAGVTLHQITSQQGPAIPADQFHHKGWAGQLLEPSLGATANSLPEPDFQHIGVELKTLPLNRSGSPKESAFVCLINLTRIGPHWDNFLVKYKFSCVPWVPIEADPEIPLVARRVGSAILWSPDKKQESTLKQNWQELMSMIAIGKLKQITAHQREYLQVRPKATNNRAITKGINNEREEILTLSRGFYLRTSLTKQILNQNVESA